MGWGASAYKPLHPQPVDNGVSDAPAYFHREPQLLYLHHLCGNGNQEYGMRNGMYCGNLAQF